MKKRLLSNLTSTFQSSKTPIIRAIGFIAALGFGLCVTFVWPRQNGVSIDIDSSPRAKAARNNEPYDLAELRVLNRVILQVKNQYVDPERVNARRMFLGGLRAIERSVAPVIVRHREGDNQVTVRVRNQEQTFKMDDVQSPWSLAYKFREVFGFLQKNLTEEDVKPKDVEYVAINGMLRTLDPHSILLTPEVFEEMRTSTRGEFGGLGIVISIRDGQLAVIRPMPDTPATRAGLKKGDYIVKINEESTLNMPLQEAVSRLRGAPDSKVSVWVVRNGPGGWAQPKRFELTRAVIHIPSVESRMLSDNIGFVKIKTFQGNTYEDMHKALTQLKQRSMRGLILDLRENPGGLLDQAIKVADAFLHSGTIVTTSANDPSQRDEKYAKPEGTEPNYAMVVLINGASASASEIVSGALKNHDRALIVGQQSFGKGSVQVLYDFPDDGSALKLTVAQYLTPGDVSIQGVGIVPDIAIDPMTIDPEDMDLSVDQNYLREADLKRHLTNAQAQKGPKPSIVLQYYLPKSTRDRLREANPEDLEENEQENEFLTRFSRELLSGAKGQAGRRELLNTARAVAEKTRQTELQKAKDELNKLGIQWDVGPNAGPAKLEVSLSTNRAGNEVVAGQPFSLKAKVTNKGTVPVYQLRATTKSDFYLFNTRELVFGKVMPGETKEWTTTLGVCKEDKKGASSTAAVSAGERKCMIPMDITDRADGIRVTFAESYGRVPTASEIRTVVHGLPRPLFAYQVQVSDEPPAGTNPKPSAHSTASMGNGYIEPGETAYIYLNVKNVGKGKTYETQANLSNATGAGLLLKDGRFRLDDMNPGEERQVVFTVEALASFPPDKKAEVEVQVRDTNLREGFEEKIVLPMQRSGADVALKQERKSAKVAVKDGAWIWTSPSADARPLGTVGKGSWVANAKGQVGDYYKVEFGNQRNAWVKSQDVLKDTPKGKAAGKPTLVFNHQPPSIDLSATVALVSKDNSLHVSGVANDETRVRDVYIMVGSQKVYYQPGDANAKQLKFDAAIPLQPGTNYVSVVARETDRIATRKTFVVRRDGTQGQLLETPKHVWEDADMMDDDLVGD